MQRGQGERRAKEASLALAALPIETRNAALLAMADAVEKNKDTILAENQKDLDAAEKMVNDGKITAAAAKRLVLKGSKLQGVIDGLRSVESLPDPLGKKTLATELDENLNLYRVTCPIGVIAMVFESRPDALPQIASLCLKSGNAVLLKGGSEALNSNRALSKVLDEAARSVEGIPEGWISLLETREEIADLLKLDEYIDLMIPRGSNEFVRYIMDNTKIPVTGHRDGICHTYIHTEADADMAAAVAVDGKCQYPAVCNATETVLIDKAAIERVLPGVLKALKDKGVELRLDSVTMDAAKANGIEAVAATDEDWQTEYLDLIISVKAVDDMDDAIGHINRYGSHHTDAIVTRDEFAAQRFMDLVDSSSVLHNCSTRFADGFRYGLGAEVGISTEKIHSRGPVGLEGLTIYKYRLFGKGQVVSDYSGDDAKSFTHRPLPLD